MAERTRELSAANLRLEKLATEDALTGIANRRSFDEKLMELWHAFQRTQRPFSCLILDIDHFKQVNDVHGHALGDQVLRELAGVLHDQVRVTDVLARYGGEEFALLLPETLAQPDALAVAEKIRETVENSRFVADLRITVSIGLSQVRAEDEALDKLFERADEALYRAKHQGRNRVACA
ncbi:GGDEF domain-containing protein [Halopseudomonas salegens]|uniref:GGDEF domain-containing protein n=1 Tax=Halopseudomonas salegens TaxID=1434072 RepID=UPI001E4EF961|nr:GGDEF domain-containing protein [Halopseudomonas salegens]